MFKGLIFAAALLSLMPAPARAQDSLLPDKIVTKSSATVNAVRVSTSAFGVADTPLLAGSDYVVIQSTYAGGAFCCSDESSATSAETAGKGCLRAKREAGGGFYEYTVRRWAQNLRVYCKGLDLLNAAFIVNVRQSK